MYLKPAGKLDIVTEGMLHDLRSLGGLNLDSDWWDKVVSKAAEAGGYIYTFANDRALFLTGQIKTANQLRDMNSEFGILPFPKLDDTQDEYYTYITGNNLMLTIPVTNQSPEETAAILDALTYYSYKNLLPIYYGNKVEQKGLRNDDSIEMLDHIRSGRGIDIADYFLLNSSVTSELTSAILNSTGTAASIAESNRSKVETAITVFMETIEKEH